MAVLRSALFVDFDNIFTRLHEHDPEAARAFGDSPRHWFGRLAAHGLARGQERRFLFTRIYFPSTNGSSPTFGGQRNRRPDVSQYRRPLVEAGFEVVDQQAVADGMTHTAGMQLVVDVLASLGNDAPVDEYLIACGDLDLAPLLHALRAVDRSTGVISATSTATAYSNIADLVIGTDPLLELIGRGHKAAETTAASIISKEMSSATKAVRLSALGQTIREAIGDTASTTGWFGHGTMRDFVDSLERGGLATNPGFVWDPARHAPPLDPTAGLTENDLPPPIAAIRLGADLPLLASPTWPLLFEHIAVYGRRGARPLTLTECTITVRNELEGADPLASRSVVNSVLHRIQNAGLPLDREPSPDANELQATFKASIVAEYVAAGREMTDGLNRALDRWLNGENGSS